MADGSQNPSLMPQCLSRQHPRPGPGGLSHSSHRSSQANADHHSIPAGCAEDQSSLPEPPVPATTHPCSSPLHPPSLREARSLLRSPRMQEGPPLPQLSRDFQLYLPLLAPQRPTPVTDVHFENSQPSEQLAGYRLELSLTAYAFCSSQLLASGYLEHFP